MGRQQKKSAQKFQATFTLIFFGHSRAIHLYRAGMPLALLSEWLGHAQLETTMIYAYADTKMKRDAIQKATGNNNPLRSNEQIPYWKGDDQIIRKLYGLK
ncbi:hypothetical protein SSCH_400004 [Syntrophaceticus schinkii]|uniref:Tyr recombinase domain-containing protein n=1 Tax=Syntrophaceticus schinkii TaxID=499207 RepID=A0A0B7MLV6_9FIRM|nr:hypothetical protein SSCH_400004 [Syntrophaceticus schinkii]